MEPEEEKKERLFFEALAQLSLLEEEATLKGIDFKVLSKDLNSVSDGMEFIVRILKVANELILRKTKKETKKETKKDKRQMELIP